MSTFTTVLELLDFVTVFTFRNMLMDVVHLSSPCVIKQLTNHGGGRDDCAAWL